MDEWKEKVLFLINTQPEKVRWWIAFHEAETVSATKAIVGVLMEGTFYGKVISQWTNAEVLNYLDYHTFPAQQDEHWKRIYKEITKE